MARFSRLRRSAQMLFLAAGIGGLSAGTAWSCIGAQESAPSIMGTSKAVAVDAYISGFKAIVGTGAVQQYGSHPPMAHGKTLAQVLLKQNATEGKNFLNLDFDWNHKSAAEVASAGSTQSSSDAANEAHLESISLKFLAMEKIEAAALAHCRELAVHTNLFGSVVASLTQVSPAQHSGTVAVPGFSFETVTTTVTVPDGGTVLIGANKFKQQPASRSTIAVAEAMGMESSRHLLQIASPTPFVQHHVGADGLERIGVDFELVRPSKNSLAQQVTPRLIIIEEEEDLLLGVAENDAPPAPQTVAAALMANGAKAARQLQCVQIAPADYIQVTAYRAVTSSYEALLEMPFSMDKVVTLSVEVSPFQENCAPGITGCFGPAPLPAPTLRMSSLTQERMLRHFAQAAEACVDEAMPAVPGATCILPDAEGHKALEAKYQFPEIHSWKQLQAQRTDAAPAENPAAEDVTETGIEPQPEAFVQQLPGQSDAPLVNPPAVAAVSPTMSPLEYAEIHLTQDERENWPEGSEMLLSEYNSLTGRILGFDLVNDTIITTIKREAPRVVGHHDEQVQQTAHDESAKPGDNPMLRALGGAISVTPCESETCKGFTIQFAPCPVTPCEKPAAAAEAQAFDGPAQVTLQDVPGKCGNGFVWPAQPIAHEESLDELAQRLEREFLRRAVAGQIQIPEACETKVAPACKEPALTCPGGCGAGVGDKCGCLDPFQIGVCQAGKCAPCLEITCPPGPYAERGTPGIALPDPVGMAKFPSPNDKPSTCQPGTCSVSECPVCYADAYRNVGVDPRHAALPQQYPTPLFGNSVVSNPGVCGNIVLDPVCLPAPPTYVATAAACCTANNPASAGVCQCAACPKGCGGECCCAKKDHPPVPAVTINPFVVGPPMVPTCTGPAPQMAMVPHAPSAYAPFVRAPQVALPTRTPVNPELLETYRDISRALDQLAERCESQALYEKADELRDLAREYRMSARIVHGHLNAMAPLPCPMPAAQPVAWFPPAPMMTAPMLPYPMATPPTYVQEPQPTFGPPAAPAAPAALPQPLPIAQPMMTPRY